jgi:hypothetical protein
MESPFSVLIELYNSWPGLQDQRCICGRKAEQFRTIREFSALSSSIRGKIRHRLHPARCGGDAPKGSSLNSG